MPVLTHGSASVTEVCAAKSKLNKQCLLKGQITEIDETKVRPQWNVNLGESQMKSKEWREVRIVHREDDQRVGPFALRVARGSTLKNLR